MYPLKMTNLAAGGYAVANDADAHQRLTEAGYEPKLVAPIPPTPEQEKAAVIEALDALGIKYDKRLSLENLAALLTK